MTNYSLHKIPEGFIITSDETPDKMYQGFYYLDGKLFHTDKTMLQTGCKKVIVQQDQIDFSALSEEEQKRIGWFYIEKFFKEDTETVSWGTTNEYDAFNKYLLGFQKAQELLSERRFTLNEVKGLLFQIGNEMRYKGVNFQSYSDYFNKKQVSNEVDKIIQSISQQSWKVEIEMDVIPDSDNYGTGEIFHSNKKLVPKLTNGKVKILKLL
jgi:hypothetical protein